MVGNCLQPVDGLAMLEVTHQEDNGKRHQGEDGPTTSTKWGFARPNFFGHQAEQARNNQSQNKRRQNDWFNNEIDVPGIPLEIKRRKGANSIIVGKVE